MRLFGEVDGVVDSHDTGWLLMPPFRHERTDAPPEKAGGLTYQMILGSVAVRLEESVGIPENVRVRTRVPSEEEPEDLLLCEISDYENPPYRSGAAPGFFTCQVEVTCFGRSKEDPGRAGRLADRVLVALQGKTIPLFDFRDEEVPLFGYLKLREGEVVDRSLGTRSELGSVRRVCVVRVRGTAEGERNL